MLGVSSSGRYSIGDRLDGDAGSLPYEVQVADLRRGGVRVLARGEGVASAGISPDGASAAYSPDGHRIVVRALGSRTVRTLVDVAPDRSSAGGLVLPSAAWGPTTAGR